MLSGLVNTEFGLIKRCGRKKDKQRAYLTGVAISWLLLGRAKYLEMMKARQRISRLFQMKSLFLLSGTHYQLRRTLIILENLNIYSGIAILASKRCFGGHAPCNNKL